jgi:predicted transcriptional regulator
MAIHCQLDNRFIEPAFIGGYEMGKTKSQQNLGRRERQIMDVIFELGEASVARVLERLPDPPSYSAVRTMIRHLEGKGYLRHRREGTKYVYRSTEAKDTVSRSALRHMIKTFFGGSASDAVAAILDVSSEKLSKDEFSRIERLIEAARKEGR